MTDEMRASIEKEIAAARRSGYEEGYAAAQRKCLLQAADEINSIVNSVWRQHKDSLQKWANVLGRTLHTGIPGEDVNPLNSAADDRSL